MQVTKEEAKNSWKYYGLFYSGSDRVISEEYLITKETGDEDVLCFDFAVDKWRSLSRAEFQKLLKDGKQQGELAEIQETDALWYPKIIVLLTVKGMTERLKRSRKLERRKRKVPGGMGKKILAGEIRANYFLPERQAVLHHTGQHRAEKRRLLG